MISVRTSKTRARFSRRALLKSMGLSAAFVPLIHAERALGAGPGGFVKRLVTITWTNGMPVSTFWPASETDPTGSEVLKPLAPLASKVLVAAGVDLAVMTEAGRRSDGHFTYPIVWSGTYKNTGGQSCTATGPSLDQAYAEFVAKQVNLPIASIFAAPLNTGPKVTSSRSDGAPNTPETDPARLFQRAFASTSLPSDQMLAIRARRKSILDFVNRELTSFGSRLGADDKAKVKGHLDAVRQLELQITAASPASCQAAMAPPAASDFPAKTKALNDIVALALRCDITRSVALMWGANGGSGPGSFPFLNITADYHGIAHSGASAYAQKTKIDNWYYSQVAYLAQQLESFAELGGTLLDHSVIAVTTDMAEGSSHYNGRLPYVMIGSAGGYLKTGRVVKLGNWAGKTGNYWTSDSGVPNNKVLATLANALDMPVQSFGTGHPGTVPELTK